jgi:hypothetical protein
MTQPLAQRPNSIPIHVLILLEGLSLIVVRVTQIAEREN